MFLCGCKEKKQTKDFLQINGSALLVFSGEAETQSISYTSHPRAEAVVISESPWCQVKAVGSQNIPAAIEVSVSENGTTEREATISVTAGKAEAIQITVKQFAAASFFEVIADNVLRLDKEAGQQQITVNANVPFTASVSSEQNWCTASTTSTGVTVSVTENENDERTAVVTISADGHDDVNITIIQQASESMKWAKIVEQDGRFKLMIDGVETYIKGAGGSWPEVLLDVAVDCGANAFRYWGRESDDLNAIVDEVKNYISPVLARPRGLYWMQGIRLSSQASQYNNETWKAQKRAEAAALAELLKNDRNLLIYSLGNEVDHSNGTARDVPAVWQFINELAQIIKSIDKDHLVTTTLCDMRVSSLNFVAENTPDLDLLCLQVYGPSTSQVKKSVDDSNYRGAYIMGEFGPDGWWEVPRTGSGAPIEQTSEEKRIVYEERYNMFKSWPRCLGSWVYSWQVRMECTPTWFSMFVERNVSGLPLNLEKTPMVEAMKRVWTGVEPTQTAPVVTSISINGNTPRSDNTITVNRGATFTGSVNAYDREGNTMSYVWEILKERTSNYVRPDRVGAVQTTSVPTLNATAINDPGNYRLYVYVLDGTGFVGTANAPFSLTGEMLDITASVLTNYESPFSYYGECVHNNRSWMASDWKVNAAAAPSGNVYDNLDAPQSSFNGKLSMVGYSSWPAGTYANGKLYRTVELERGTYRFSAFVFRSIGTYEAYVAAAMGNDLPDTADAERDALDCVSIPTEIGAPNYNTELFVEFTLSEKNTVSLGFVVTFTGQGEFYFNKVELKQIFD